MFFADDAVNTLQTPAQAERSAWIELVGSLRQDIERLKAERPQTEAPALEEKPVSVVGRTLSTIRRRPAPPAADAESTASKLSRIRPTHRPVQDQWGLFDPEQCGFAALLAKLDEIGARDDVSAG
jgi:hypothetical protein